MAADFHLHRQHAVVGQRVVQVRAVGVERVRGQDRTDPQRDAALLGRLGGGAQQPEVRDRRVVDQPVESGPVHVGIRRGPDAGDDVAQVQVVDDRATGADPDDGTDTVIVDQLVGVDRRRRHAHPRSLHRDRHAAPPPGESEHAAHLRVALGIVEVRLGDPLARIGSPGSRTRSAISPGCAPMCTLMVGLLVRVADVSILPAPMG
jgi:hypothetical protein